MSASPSVLGVASGAAAIPPAPELAALRAHPRFEEAMRALAEALVQLHRRNRVQRWFLNDRALVVLTHAALYLDADARDDDPRSGLTPGRFKAFCAATGVCSDGRAAAVLALMRFSGHLDADVHPADGRTTRLRPSAQLLESFRMRYRIGLSALAMLCPELVPAAGRLGDRGFERALCGALGARYRGGERILRHAPRLRLFAERDAGVLVLFALMLGAPRGAPLPPADPVPLSIAALARQFHVSRTHILRLVRDAEAAGLLTRIAGERGGEIRFEPELREGLQIFVASALQFLGACATEALAARQVSLAGQARGDQMPA